MNRDAPINKLRNEYNQIIWFYDGERYQMYKFYTHAYRIEGYQLSDYFFKYYKRKFSILKKVRTFQLIFKYYKDLFDSNIVCAIKSKDFNLTQIKNKAESRAAYRKVDKLWTIYQNLIQRL